MSYQSAAELEKAFHELIIKSFGRETEDSWVFEGDARKAPGGVQKLAEIERAQIRLKTAQMREKIQRRLGS